MVFHPTQVFHGLLTTIRRPWSEQCAQINHLTPIWELSLLIRVDKQLPCMASSLTIALSVFIVRKMSTSRPVANPNFKVWVTDFRVMTIAYAAEELAQHGLYALMEARFFCEHYMYFLYLSTVD